ncbi:unnamed protein product [Meganyctiphanes norvegica]|uniref:Uncharacterized protein n=1 Tax=Meganyctiphanes norvegica TaxID=48144 RepID=A0AAV2PXD1_MEGNR
MFITYLLKYKNKIMFWSKHSLYKEALVDVGHEVLTTVLEWRFVGGDLRTTANIKQAVLNNLKYTGRQYKDVFTEEEMQKLDDGVNFKEIEIILLYKLLQSVCGLADHEHSTWTELSLTGERSLEFDIIDYKKKLKHFGMSQ